MDREDLVKKVVNGEISLRKIDEFLEGEEAVNLRRAAVERLTGADLSNIGKYTIDIERAVKRNIENMIGVAQVPLGVAGPVLIKGEYANGKYYLPLATTEGALVASVNRGCKAVTLSGGVKVRILDDKMTRAALFKTDGVEDAIELVNWINAHKEDIAKKAEETSHHLKIKSIETWVAGRNVWVRFSGETGDAMGMNMLTIATEHACSWIEDEFGKAEFIAASGNMCVDKKPNALDFITGRGKTVAAEAEIDRDVVERILKTTPERMADVAYRKNLLGSAMSGSYGFNAHFANIIAAMYIALGQDAAHVVEGSMGISMFEVKDGKLYVSVLIPAVQVGTVGGGTGLNTQREALSILGIHGGGEPAGANAKKLAEIVGAAVLAGEVSLIGALAARHLGKAHKELGRGQK